MRRFLFLSTAALTAAAPAFAADIAVKTSPIVNPAVYNWSGFYAGVNAGAAWGAYDPQTSAAVSGFFGPIAVSQVNSIGPQKINPTAFSVGEQAGYNWQFGRLVLGLEAGLDYLHLNGTANSGAVPFIANPGRQFVISSYAHSDWLFTLRPRAGLAVNNWLFYVTGGLALTNVKGDLLYTGGIAGGATGALQSASIDQNKLGYAVGAGFEWGVSDRLSLKAEYLHAGFDRIVASQTSSNIPLQQFTQSEALSANLVRLGLNYRFGDNMPWSGSAAATEGVATGFPNLELEAGTRVWFSSGRIGAPQPLFNPANTRLISRLTFSGLSGISGETFARVDHTSGFFAKGFLGAGGISNGSLNDEDFPGTAGAAYSNTLSNAKGHIGYGVVDIGYSVLRTPTAKLGAFVGYNYYAEDINTYGCAQLANGAFCAGGFPSNFLVIAQSGHYDALRLGLTSQFMLSDKLKLTSEAAYLPWVNFTGQDDHNARQLLLPEKASDGTGVMLETILGYDVSNAWNVGVGARYWAYNMKNGSTTFNFLGLPPQIVEPTRSNSERYGMFVQSSYKWGEVAPAASTAMPLKAPAASMNWTGIYVGGHLGGGVSRDTWSDPFGSTRAALGTINVAGFGDTTRGTGPLGGLQIGADWQTGKWVLGLGGELSATDLRGENTCFSGLGGINCQHIINAVGTVTGRVGFAWDQSLIYARAGGAWANTSYNLLGNTGVLSLGSGSTSLTRAGWVAGAGLEYALTKKWTTFVEYDHLGFDTATVKWPTVAMINAQNISIGQSVDLFKLGVNYRFGWPDSVDAKR
jgi:opacity protein-like surface antigen